MLRDELVGLQHFRATLFRGEAGRIRQSGQIANLQPVGYDRRRQAKSLGVPRRWAPRKRRKPGSGDSRESAAGGSRGFLRTALKTEIGPILFDIRDVSIFGLSNSPGRRSIMVRSGKSVLVRQRSAEKGSTAGDPENNRRVVAVHGPTRYRLDSGPHKGQVAARAADMATRVRKLSLRLGRLLQAQAGRRRTAVGRRAPLAMYEIARL